MNVAPDGLCFYYSILLCLLLLVRDASSILFAPLALFTQELHDLAFQEKHVFRARDNGNFTFSSYCVNALRAIITHYCYTRRAYYLATKPARKPGTQNEWVHVEVRPHEKDTLRELAEFEKRAGLRDTDAPWLIDHAGGLRVEGERWGTTNNLYNIARMLGSKFKVGLFFGRGRDVRFTKFASLIEWQCDSATDKRKDEYSMVTQRSYHDIGTLLDDVDNQEVTWFCILYGINHFDVWLPPECTIRAFSHTSTEAKIEEERAKQREERVKQRTERRTYKKKQLPINQYE